MTRRTFVLAAPAYRRLTAAEWEFHHHEIPPGYLGYVVAVDGRDWFTIGPAVEVRKLLGGG